VNGAWGHKGQIIRNQATTSSTPVPVGSGGRVFTASGLANRGTPPPLGSVTHAPGPVGPVPQNFVVGAHIQVEGVADAQINGRIGTMIGMSGPTMVKVNFINIGLKILPKDKCTVVHAGARRLEEKEDDKNEEEPTEEAIQRSKDIIAKEADPLPEVDRFYVEIDPKALSYKIDKDLMKELIRRKAFRGLEDGREKELGEAKITHFKLHRGDNLKHFEDDDTMIPVGPEAKFEWDSHVDTPFVEVKKKHANFAVAWVVAGVAVLSVAALAVGFYRSKQNGQVLPYMTVEEESSTTPVE